MLLAAPRGPVTTQEEQPGTAPKQLALTVKNVKSMSSSSEKVGGRGNGSSSRDCGGNKSKNIANIASGRVVNIYIKPVKLGNGSIVYMNLFCHACGTENSSMHKRLRCDKCSKPLQLFSKEEAEKLKALPNKASRHRAPSEQSVPVTEGNISAVSRTSRSSHAPDAFTPMLNSTRRSHSARKKASGGLANKRPGLGAGARHGMDAQATLHCPAQMRQVRIGNGDIVTIDILCRNCGYEQRPEHRKLRCEACFHPLEQLGGMGSQHIFRAVGAHTRTRTSKDKRKSGGKTARNGKSFYTPPGKYRRDIMAGARDHRAFGGKPHYGFSGKTIRSILNEGRDAKFDDINMVDGGETKKKQKKKDKPSLTNLRHETNDVIGDWACCICAKTGKNYFYNMETREATWCVPKELETLF